MISHLDLPIKSPSPFPLACSFQGIHSLRGWRETPETAAGASVLANRARNLKNESHRRVQENLNKETLRADREQQRAEMEKLKRQTPCEMNRLYVCTVVPLYRCTVCTFVRLYRCTVCTFVPLYRCTVVPLYRCTTVVPLYRCTVRVICRSWPLPARCGAPLSAGASPLYRPFCCFAPEDN